jgi:periplasmic protein TonB
VLPARPVAGMATNQRPEYPESARRRGEQGRVVLRVAVSGDGAPVEVSVVSSSGHPSLDGSAIAAVRRWRFIPATQGGTPLASTAEVPIQFRLEE